MSSADLATQSTEIDRFAILVHRATVDREFREKLKTDPHAALAEYDLKSTAERIVVHEFDPNEQHLILPPLHEPAKRRESVKEGERVKDAYSKDPPSRVTDCCGTCALTSSDSRVWYGVAPSRRNNHGSSQL
jgi:hypothetical protein